MSLDFEELTPDEADAVMAVVATRGDAPPVAAHSMTPTYRGIGEDHLYVVMDETHAPE